MARRSGHSGRRGFTLIELLVVVSIIALLVSILMPALSRARRQTRRTVCTSQLKQYGIASYTYAAQNKGYAPPLTVPGYPWVAWPNRMGNHILLMPYMGVPAAEIEKLKDKTLAQNGKSVPLFNSWNIFICPGSNRREVHLGYNGTENSIMTEYVQYCGTNSGSYPGSNEKLDKMKPRVVLYCDRIWASQDPMQCGGFHDSGDQEPGQVNGGNSARADGSANWTGDYPVRFNMISPSEFTFWIPKFIE